MRVPASVCVHDCVIVKHIANKHTRDADYDQANWTVVLILDDSAKPGLCSETIFFSVQH